MNCIWKKEYSLRACDFDKYNRIKPSSILELFQDAAGQHGEELGVGHDSMMERCYFWVLTRIKFKILSNPQNYQKVFIKTWPLAPNRLIYRREYSIESENGEVMIEGSSEWVVMHSEKRCLVSDSAVYPFGINFCNDMVFDQKIAKVKNFETENEPRTVNASFSELDVNNHVNNTKYANYVVDAAVPGKDDVLSTFQIDYRKEVLEGAELKVYHEKNGNEVLSKGLNENGDIMFACRMEYA